MKIVGKVPRGIRLNNPGNVRKSSIYWKGEVIGFDHSFETFDSMEDGVRAIYMILIHYIKKDGLDTIMEIIHKWAPPVENATGSYIKQVCKLTGMTADHPVQPTYEMLKPIVHAICVVENGGDYIDPEIFAMAWHEVGI
jgi:hypothetical protein